MCCFRSGRTLFMQENSDWNILYTEEDTINIVEFLVENIFVVFAGKVFQYIVGIPMCNSFATLQADIFQYSHEAEFIYTFIALGLNRTLSQFTFTYRHIDDVLLIDNPGFHNHLGQMFLAPGIDGSRFLPVLGNSIRNWWSRTLCNLTRGGPLIRFICGVTSENLIVHYFSLMLELKFKEFVILKNKYNC